MKQCRTCEQTKPLEAFSPHTSCEQGRYPDCKECRNAWARAKYAGDPEAILEGQRDSRRRRPKNKEQSSRKAPQVLADPS